LAAAALAGLMVIPRVFSPHPVAESQVQSTAHAPPIAGNRPDTGPSADARPSNALPSPAPLPQAAARSRAIASAEPGAGAPSRKNAAPLADAVRSGAAAENVASFGHPASPVPDPSAALRRAAQTGDVTQLRALLGTQVPVDAPDERGQTALMLAASQGQIASVDVLLAHGADPNAANADGTTPLQAALAADQPAIVAALRRAGAR
jgi:hypothetical protein